MIEVKGLYKSFGDNDVLKNINARFETGKTSLIIGASGSGKSTLTRCLVGLIDPTEGHVYYDDRDFFAMNTNQRKTLRKEIGFLFQHSALFDFMTVEENVRFPLDILTNMTKKEKQDRVDFVLDRVELGHAHKLLPSELSGGMKKRVGIGRAISPKPRYLFCDEPNSGLDPQTSIVIDALIQEITHENDITTLVITHDMNSVVEIGEYIMFIHKGEVWWEGTQNEILKTDNHELLSFVDASGFLTNKKG